MERTGKRIVLILFPVLIEAKKPALPLFNFSNTAGLCLSSVLEKHWKEDCLQSSFQCFLKFDCRKRLGSGDVQRVTVRHGW